MKAAFLCTGNSARSQMAEGLLRALSGGTIEVFSAGTHPSRLHPRAVEVMREIGVDISSQRSKGISELPADLDLVITVCDRAAAECPILATSARRHHWSVPDPAAVSGSSEEIQATFRAARDDLRTRILDLLERDNQIGRIMGTA